MENSGYHEVHDEDYEPPNVIAAQFDRIRNEAAQKIELFGGARGVPRPGGATP